MKTEKEQKKEEPKKYIVGMPDARNLLGITKVKPILKKGKHDEG